MKKFTWKKLMSLVLVAALVIGCLQLNAKRVSAEDGEPAAAAPVLTIEPSADGKGGENFDPSIAYTVDRTPGEATETNKIAVVLALDTSNSMNEIQNADEWSWLERWFYYWFGTVPSDAETALDYALEAAEEFTSAIGEVAEVSFVTFNKTVGTPDSLSGVTAHEGTNIDAALEAVEGMEGVKALVILTDGEPTYATENGKLIGNGYTGNSNPDIAKIKTETNAAITRLTEKDITIYAINYGGQGNVFESQNNDKIITYSADFNVNDLKDALTKIATEIKKVYATDAYIEAVLGDYVEYVGNKEEDKVDVKKVTAEDGTEKMVLRWDIPDVAANATGAVQNVTPDLKFAVVVRDEEGNKITDQDTVVAKLLELADTDDQITVVTTDEEGNPLVDEEGNPLVVIKVAVTVDGQTKLYYKVNGVYQEPKDVDCTATKAVTVYSFIPEVEPEEHTYMINYVCDENVVAVSTGSAVLPAKAVADYANAVAE